MESDTHTVGVVERSSNALSGRTLDVLVTALSALMMLGVALDFRSHAAGISFEEEGFFTPEHVFFYSMFLGIAAVLGAATYRERRSGASWLEAVPPGYGWGVAGVLLFGFGGAGDFAWHSAFGFEEGVEGLTSPSHLALAIGATLFLASPLRATWRREETPSGVGLLPVAIPAGLVLTVLGLFTTYVNPLINLYAAGNDEASRALGVASLFLFPAFLVGGGLALTRRFDLPAGTLGATFGIPALACTLVIGRFEFAIPVVVAGLVGDGLVRWRPPTPDAAIGLRAFGALVPAVFVAGYLAIFEATIGIAWTVHVWSGAVVLAAFAGLLVTYAIVPDAAWTVDRARTPAEK